MKNKFQKLILVIFYSVLSSGLIAQIPFKPAYIVTDLNDTIQGYIKADIDDNLKSSFFFRESENGKVDVYSTSDVKAFVFDNGRCFERFISYKKVQGDSVRNCFFAKNIMEGKIDIFTIKTLKKDKPDFVFRNNQTMKIVHIQEPKKVQEMTDKGLKKRYVENFYLGYINYVKYDSTNITDLQRNQIRYATKDIKEDIREYNTKFEEEYPIKEYVDQKDYTYNVSFGVAILNPYVGFPYRLSYFRYKNNPELTYKFSTFRGITFHNNLDANVANSNTDANVPKAPLYYMNIMPFGVSYHGRPEKIIPFIYAGVGVGLYARLDPDGNIFKAFPTINLGGGVKYKIGNKAIVLELVPSLFAVYMNIGYEF